MTTVFDSLRCRVRLTWDDEKHEEVEVNRPDDIYRIVRDELAHSDRELFLSVLLTAHNTVIGIETVGVGSLCSCSVVPRELFKSAILANAGCLVLCHNHPSGDLTPSNEDRQMTEKLKKAGDILGIPILDHIIITNKGFTSLAEHTQTKSILSRTRRTR